MAAHPHKVVTKVKEHLGFLSKKFPNVISCILQSVGILNNNANSRIQQEWFKIKPHHASHFKHNHLAQPDKIKRLWMFIGRVNEMQLVKRRNKMIIQKCSHYDVLLAIISTKHISHHKYIVSRY